MKIGLSKNKVHITPSDVLLQVKNFGKSDSVNINME